MAKNDRESSEANHINLPSRDSMRVFAGTRKNSPQGRRRRSGWKERKREAEGETDGVRSMEAKGDEQGCYCVVVWLNVLIPITTICPGSASLRALWPGHRRKTRLRPECCIVCANDKSISSASRFSRSVWPSGDNEQRVSFGCESSILWMARHATFV